MSPGKSRVFQRWAILLLAVIAPACGGGSKGGVTLPPGGLNVTLTTPSTLQKGAISIGYTLINPAALTCTIGVEFFTAAGGWKPATPGGGGDGISDLSSSPGGVAHIFSWNSLADAVALGAVDASVRIRITPTDVAAGTFSTTSNFQVDNSANTLPSVAITSTLIPTQSGLILVSYTLGDNQADPCSLQASFSVDGGAFSPATRGPGGDGLVNLASSPGGVSHTFLWNSVADGVAPAGTNNAVKLRFVAVDAAPGLAATTADFSVNNSGKSSGSSLGAPYPIQVNGSSLSDWATSVATDGVSLYVLGFEGCDFEAGAPDSSWKLSKRVIGTGAPDPAFGTGGDLTGNPGPGLDVPFKVAVSGGSLFLLIARETSAGSRSFVLRIEKRNAVTGALVAAFGGAGFVQTSTPATCDGIPLPWTLAADGSFLYVAGSQEVSATNSQWRILKMDKTTGLLVSGFGTGGTVDENPTGLVDGCFRIVIDAASMWLVGADNVHATSSSNGRIRIEKRKLLDGTLDAGFGAGGVVTVDAGLGDDIGEDAVSDGASLFVFSRVETPPGSGVFQGRIEKRNLTTGAAGPVVTGTASDPTGALPFGHLALDGGNLFVCQADGSTDVQWCIEKRSSSTLSLVTSFGTAGVVQINPPPAGYDRPLGIVAAGGVLLLAGMDSVASSEQWRIEARWR